jgi:Skp family chaperone for outer membrane proteins
MQLFKPTILAAAACIMSAQAQEAPRFAFFSSDYIIENTAQGMRVFAEVKATQNRLQEALKVKQEEIQGLTQQLNSSSLNEDGRARVTRNLEDGRVAFERLGRDSERAYQGVLQAAYQQLATEINPIVDALAKEQKLHCVFQLQDALVAWVDQAWYLQFTQEVAKRYDAAYPGSGAAAPKENAPRPAAASGGATTNRK